MKKYNVCSLFCGCGGGDVGIEGGFSFIDKSYKELPFQTVLGIDNNKKAINTFNLNFRNSGIHSSIEDYDFKSIKDIDIVTGGFPCQSFSTVNPTKDPFDDRGQLYKHMAKVLREFQPKAFIAENVKGLYVLKKGEIFKRVCKEFEDAGYILTHQLVNSADFGVPQKRVRIVIVGIRKDLGLKYVFPNPTHNELGTNGLEKWTPLKKVVKSLIPEDNKYYFSEKAVQGMKNAKNNMKRGLYQDLDKPSLTVTSHLAKVSLNSRDPVLLVDKEKELYRRFTPSEASRIQSFPDSFKFSGSESDAYRQIGNAIAPVVMWHIANALSSQLDKIQ